MSDVLYLCDHKACDICHSEYCNHTTDVKHAIDFERAFHGGDVYVQKEVKPSEVMVIRIHRSMKHSEFKSLYNDLVDMKNEGLILLPHYCEVVVPNEEEINDN